MPSFACRRAGNQPSEKVVHADGANHAVGVYGRALNLDICPDPAIVEVRSLDEIFWTRHRVWRVPVKRLNSLIDTMIVSEQLPRDLAGLAGATP